MSMEQGYLCLVLHCHLPFVRHPEHDEFLEEDWFFEGVSETYLPLLEVFEGLRDDGVPFRATLCLSPPLCEMLTDQRLQERCARYVGRRLDLLEREVTSRRGTPFYEAAVMYLNRFQRVWNAYQERHRREVLARFARLQEEGWLEIIASAATHSLLPLLGGEEAVFAQVEQGCRNYRKHFGRRPRGIWLPECAFAEGLDRVLRRCGLEYCFLESNSILLADPQPVHGVFAPVLTPGGVAAFGRDPESSRQVWSRQDGYPGDPAYREFYRDLGYDADYDYIRPYLHPDGVRRSIGIKYHRITGGDVPLGRKEPYVPAAASRKASEHAALFVSRCSAQVSGLSRLIGRRPIIVAPYDAELFGHWWLEGVEFLDCVIREAARRQYGIRMVTPTEYLSGNPTLQRCNPAPSTWGDKGHFDVWLNGSNDWIYPHLHHAERVMVTLAAEHVSTDGLLCRALNQCARELMLGQSSDWPFLMALETADSYAVMRVKSHLSRFSRLSEQIRAGLIAEHELLHLEQIDNIFSELDYSLYRPGCASKRD